MGDTADKEEFRSNFSLTSSSSWIFSATRQMLPVSEEMIKSL